MRLRRFYTVSVGMVEVIRGDFLSSCDIWCSILVYHYLFAVCALLVSLVVCCAACFLIVRYKANNSPFCLQVVLIRQRAFLLVRLKGIIFSCVVWSIIIVCSQYGIISSSACKAFISFLLHVLLFGGRLCALVHIEVIRRGFAPVFYSFQN